MAEYLSPGVYIEEFEIGARPIEGVGTSTAGFLGVALRGPLKPQFIAGYEQFKRVYGSYLPKDESTLAYSIDGFFKNGGQRCFVARVAADDARDMVGEVGATNPIIVRAAGPGVWGNRLAVKIEPGSIQDTDITPTPESWDKIKLTVMYWDGDVLPPDTPPVDPTLPENAVNSGRRSPTALEVYDNLTADPASIDYYMTRINKNSSLIRVNPMDPSIIANPSDTALDYVNSDPTDPNSGSDGGTIVVGDYIGKKMPDPLEPDAEFRIGLLAFEEIDEIAILVAPDHHKVNTLSSELVLHSTKMGDRFAILHSNPSSDTLTNINGIRVPQDTTYAAFYFPWIKSYSPLLNREIILPPSGHMAGIYAKTDVERGVHKAPANVVVQGATSLQYQITKAEQDILNPRGVNCLRTFLGRGIRVWGARTCSSNSLWKYINVRRLFLFVEESIEEGTQWVVFEPNDEKLWARVKQTITQFLTTVWRNGALMGTTAEESFFVKVDRTTMTQDDIDNGRLIVIIGIAPVKPAEFVIFRITQYKGGSDTELV